MAAQALETWNHWYVNPGDDMQNEMLVIGWIRTTFASEAFAEFEQIPMDIMEMILRWTQRYDVSKKIDFSKDEYVGYLQDDGKTIERGQIIREKKNSDGLTIRSFLHFENITGKAFGWFNIPNERIRLLPHRHENNTY